MILQYLIIIGILLLLGAASLDRLWHDLSLPCRLSASILSLAHHLLIERLGQVSNGQLVYNARIIIIVLYLHQAGGHVFLVETLVHLIVVDGGG